MRPFALHGVIQEDCMKARDRLGRGVEEFVKVL